MIALARPAPAVDGVIASHSIATAVIAATNGAGAAAPLPRVRSCMNRSTESHRVHSFFDRPCSRAAVVVRTGYAVGLRSTLARRLSAVKGNRGLFPLLRSNSPFGLGRKSRFHVARTQESQRFDQVGLRHQVNRDETTNRHPRTNEVIKIAGQRRGIA